MVDYSEEIPALFKAHDVLKVTFIKKNGDVREMTCTQNFDRIPKEFHPKGTGKPAPPTLCRVFELGVGWRSFNYQSVTKVEVVK